MIFPNFMESGVFVHPYYKQILRVMKNIRLFTIGYILFFVLFTSFVFAQSKHDLNGVFEGLRKQYDFEHQSFIQEFQYRYDLKQNGNQVEGISSIYNEHGDYADVKIRGIVVGDKFYFEEYEIIDEIKDPYNVWCYKTGELQISEKDGQLVLSGETKSYMSNYGGACSGGYTYISKFNDDEEASARNKDDKASLENIEMVVELFPNPTPDFAQISFELAKKNKVSIEVFDLSGRLIATPLAGSLSKGIHQTSIDLSKESAGLYVVKVSVGDKFYSKELIKTDR